MAPEWSTTRRVSGKGYKYTDYRLYREVYTLNGTEGAFDAFRYKYDTGKHGKHLTKHRHQRSWSKYYATVTGSSSDDHIFTSSGGYYEPMKGNNQAYSQVLHFTFKGGDGNDSLVGGIGNDSLYGDRHNDTLRGGIGNDKLWGGDDNDELYGNENADSLWGGNGDDKLYGGTGNDKLWGGSNNDYISGGNGADTVYGGSGNDYINAGNGADTVDAGSGDDIIYMGARNQGQETLITGTGRDIINLGYSETAGSTSQPAVNNFWNNYGQNFVTTVGKDTAKDSFKAYAKGAAKNFVDTIAGGTLVGFAASVGVNFVTTLIDVFTKKTTPEDSLPGSSQGKANNLLTVKDFDPRYDVITFPVNTDNDELTREVTKVLSGDLQGWAIEFQGAKSEKYVRLHLAQEYLDAFGFRRNSSQTKDLLENILQTAFKVTSNGIESSDGTTVKTDKKLHLDNLKTNVGTEVHVFGALAPHAIFGGQNSNTNGAPLGGTEFGDILSISKINFKPSEWDASNWNGTSNSLSDDNSIIRGFGGDDVIVGGKGKDFLYGGDGDDLIFGWSTKSEGTSGRDVLDGGRGNDTFYVAKSRGKGEYAGAQIDGGSGTDTVSFEYSRVGVEVDLGTGGKNVGDSINTYTFTNIENVIGTDDVDKITGDNKANTFTGGKGNDTLKGMEGNDTLIGGQGLDELWGGTDRDTFVLTELNRQDAIIKDFDKNEDTLQINTQGSISLQSENNNNDTGVYVGSQKVALLEGVTASQVKLASYNISDGRTVGSAWNLIGAGDFDGDGDDDILWQHKYGLVHQWEMQNGDRVAGANINNGALIHSDWNLIGAGDFDGDGDDDILWQHKNGQVHQWEMQNGDRVASANIHHGLRMGSDWNLIGTGDFDGDGDDDILWQHKNGQVHQWEMQNGKGAAPGAHIYPGLRMGSDWNLIGTGDFDGDGDDDILWQHKNGRVHQWEMQNGKGAAPGADLISAELVSTLGSSSRLIGIGDFNNNGSDSLLWQRDNGQVFAVDPHNYSIV